MRGGGEITQLRKTLHRSCEYPNDGPVNIQKQTNLLISFDIWHWHVSNAGSLRPQKWHRTSRLNKSCNLPFVFNNLFLNYKKYK